MNLPEQILATVVIAISYGAWLIHTWIRKQPPKCRHLWEMHQKVNIFHVGNGTETPSQIKQLMRCKHCGEIKTVKLV